MKQRLSDLLAIALALPVAAVVGAAVAVHGVAAMYQRLHEMRLDIEDLQETEADCPMKVELYHGTGPLFGEWH